MARTEVLATGDKQFTMRYSGLPASENISFRVVGREEVPLVLFITGESGLAMDGFGIDYSPSLNLWLGVGLGNSGANPIKHITSPTAIPGSYTARNSHNGNADQNYRGCCYAGGGVNGGGFVTVATTTVGAGNTFNAETSADGLTYNGENLPWDTTALNPFTAVDVFYIGGGHDRLIACAVIGGHADTVATKKNGEDRGGGASAWTGVASLDRNWLVGAYSAPLDRAVIIGVSRDIIYSDDGGLTWSQQLNALPINATWGGLTWARDRFIAVALDGANRMAYSLDGITWVASTFCPAQTWRGIDYSPSFGAALATAFDGSMGLTTDGVSLIPFGVADVPAGVWTRPRWSEEQARFGVIGRVTGTNRQGVARA